ncbi:hypothetical protein MKX01_026909 [Papaver californicum]|nr:hypothetical protein MKX01_026909 [Papaver californicum]
MRAAYGTTKNGVEVVSMVEMRHELVKKSIVPIVMDGVLGIYGLIIVVNISNNINPKTKLCYLLDCICSFIIWSCLRSCWSFCWYGYWNFCQEPRVKGHSKVLLFNHLFTSYGILLIFLPI